MCECTNCGRKGDGMYCRDCQKAENERREAGRIAQLTNNWASYDAAKKNRVIQLDAIRIARQSAWYKFWKR